DDDHLLAIDDMEGETIDLNAAFAADPLDFHPQPSAAAAAFRDYIEAVTATASEAPLAPAPAEENYSTGDDEIDAEILEIFLEEAVDLLEGLDESVTAWNSERDNTSYLD